MASEPKLLTTMDGQRVSISPFDIKAIRDIDKGVEVTTHAGDTLRFPISRYVFEMMMTVDLRGTANRVSVVDPIRGDDY